MEPQGLHMAPGRRAALPQSGVVHMSPLVAAMVPGWWPGPPAAMAAHDLCEGDRGPAAGAECL